MLYKQPKSKFWWCRFTTTAGQVRCSTGTTDKKAAELVEAKLKLQHRVDAGAVSPQRTWGEATERWLTETAHKASQYDDINLLRWLDPHLSHRTLDGITTDVVSRVVDERGDIAPATKNRMLALIRAILRKAEREWGWLDNAPTLRFFKTPATRIRWLTRAEAERLLAELEPHAPHLSDMARFTLATGLRAANVTGLEWSQVDLERRVAWVHPDQAKARRAIGVPLNGTALEVLGRWQGRDPTWVFVYKGQRIIQVSTAAWYKALGRAGIENFRWHDLRHTWASWHVQGGTPLHALQELGGWASYTMVLRYAHLAPEHLAEYASRLDGQHTFSIPGGGEG